MGMGCVTWIDRKSFWKCLRAWNSLLPAKSFFPRFTFFSSTKLKTSWSNFPVCFITFSYLFNSLVACHHRMDLFQFPVNIFFRLPPPYGLLFVLMSNWAWRTHLNLFTFLSIWNQFDKYGLCCSLDGIENLPLNFPSFSPCSYLVAISITQPRKMAQMWQLTTHLFICGVLMTPIKSSS